MSRWTGSWLSGLSGAEPGDESGRAQRWPGERLGLPRGGPGSVAGRGVRLAALLLDLVLASLVTGLFVQADLQDPGVMRTFNYWAVLVWFVITVVGVSISGFTAGMALLGLRVVRTDGAAIVGPLRAAPRTLLIAVIVPAVVWDADTRGLHDKATGTVVVRTR